MAGILEFIRAHTSTVPPLAKFAVIMAIIVGIPPLSRRARLPLCSDWSGVAAR
jgi:hypothetical protein